MIGVYLGFALNNFGENQKTKQQVRTYKEMLRNEIVENLEGIAEVSPYHIKLSKDFSKLLQSEDLKKEFGAYNLQGLQPGVVYNSAYKTGIQTGIIQEFDLNLVQILNRCYTLQEKYNSFNESMISSSQSRKFPETESEIRSLLIITGMSMNDIKYFEVKLKQQYEKILELL